MYRYSKNLFYPYISLELMENNKRSLIDLFLMSGDLDSFSTACASATVPYLKETCPKKYRY